MRALLFPFLFAVPHLAPLAQTPPEAEGSVIVLSVQKAEHATTALPPEAIERLSSRASATNPALTALAATGAYIVGGAVGYMVVDAIDPTDEVFWENPSYSSEGVLYGIPIGGTLASSLAAHLVSSPDDPLWRTVLVPLAVQGAFIAGSHLFLSTQDGALLLGAPPVAVVFSTSIALWD
ncbi:hypothetical protein [Rubricoccus marinus]|uniref:Uncharacterized protein n=1 Tax=Rubricoccus marinus TaxID=716817 RepID=A0A259U1L3_9BACT|nr:hypothetical protein [Rubricoccus marinus]OZC03925.1 hypothetical protein BSZ36_13615 [Rubricoccus marinus]